MYYVYAERNDEPDALAHYLFESTSLQIAQGYAQRAVTDGWDYTRIEDESDAIVAEYLS